MLIVADAAAVVIGLCLALVLFTWLKGRAIDKKYPAVGQIIPVDGCGLHVVEIAPTSARRGDVVLIHGASGNHADLLAPLGEKLGALGFRVFAVDRPGLGWSTRPDGAEFSSLARHRALILAALEQRGVASAIIVGHSLGGVVALNFALEAPDFTRGLVLISPVSHPWPGGVDPVYTFAARRVIGWLFSNLIVMPVGLNVMRRGVAGVFAPNPMPANYIEATKTPLILLPRRYRANARDVVALKPFVTEQSKRYGAIKAPTAIISGDSDTVVYTHIHSYGCAREIVGATLTMLKGVGHSPHHSATDAVIETILAVDARASERKAERSGARAAM